jgi:hypothetical protein
LRSADPASSKFEGSRGFVNFAIHRDEAAAWAPQVPARYRAARYL